MDARQIIAELGGNKALAERLGVDPLVTYTWVRRNRIAARWAVPVVNAAQEMGRKDITLEMVMRQHSPAEAAA
jgi:DNA-binding transcriptional regulator YdaS (Cro superfamily)